MITITREIELTRMVQTEALTGVAFTGEAGGHQFVIKATMSKTPVALTGSVSGIFIGPDGAGIELDDAEIVDGQAVVTLKQACYGQRGPFGIRVFHGETGGKLTVIYSAAGYMDVGEPDTVYDPGNRINVAAISAMMDDMETAKDQATAAAAFVPNMIAPAFDASVANTAGDYVTYSGKLYRITADRAANVTWSNTSKLEVTAGVGMKYGIDSLVKSGEAYENASEAYTGDRWLSFRYGRYSANPAVSDLFIEATTAVCAFCECAKGDKFLVDVYGLTGVGRAWIIYDSEFNMLDDAGNGEHVQGVVTVTQDDAAYIAFNNRLSTQPTGYYAIKCNETLSEKLSGIQSEINGVKSSFTADVYGAAGLTAVRFEPGIIATPEVGSTGSLERVTSETGKYSAYAQVTENQKIYLSTSTGSATYKPYAFLDAEYKVVDRASANTAVRGVLEAPATSAYIVVNSAPGESYYLLVESSTEKNKVDDIRVALSNEIGQLQELINIAIKPIILDFEPGLIRTPAQGETTSLTRETSVTGFYSAYHEVEYGQKIYINATSGTSTVRPYAFLDSSLKVLERSGKAAGVYEDEVPEGAAYVVVNTVPTGATYAIILNSNGKTAENSLNVGMFNKIGVCGYSWDSGYAYSSYTGTSHAYTRRSRSWGAVLANMYGIDFACYGVPSGTTCAPDSPYIGTSGAKCWQTETHGLPKLLEDDPCDLYWFHMFGNDWNKLGSGYLGTIDDIKEDYTQNPDTFYGNYGRIMAQIKAHAPNALFVFSYREKEQSSATCVAYADALLEIAEYYGVPAINWYDDQWFLEWMDDHLVSSHPTFTDYAGMAKAADRLFAICAKSNWAYFKNFVPAADD